MTGGSSLCDVRLTPYLDHTPTAAHGHHTSTFTRLGCVKGRGGGYFVLKTSLYLDISLMINLSSEGPAQQSKGPDNLQNQLTICLLCQ